jgi:hypothetical protein
METAMANPKPFIDVNFKEASEVAGEPDEFAFADMIEQIDCHEPIGTEVSPKRFVLELYSARLERARSRLLGRRESVTGDTSLTKKT